MYIYNDLNEALSSAAPCERTDNVVWGLFLLITACYVNLNTAHHHSVPTALHSTVPTHWCEHQDTLQQQVRRRLTGLLMLMMQVI